jgi:hypothetical protein
MKAKTSRPPESGSVWLMSRSRLIGAALMCIAAAALVAGTHWLAKVTTLEQSQAQTTLKAAELALQNTQSDRARLEENLQLFGTLKQSRFARAPDRMAILETLELAGRDLRRKEVVWELAPQEKIRTINDDKTGSPVAQLVRVTMKLGASNVHEDEWLTLLAALQGKGGGYFTTDNCVYDKRTFSFAEAVMPSVYVACTLSWLYVMADPAAPRTP